jgi:hypothetical protein
MKRRRREKRERPELPLPFALNLNEPVGVLDFIIEKTEQTLKEMKRLRIILTRRREKERKRFLEEREMTDDK